MAGKDAPQTELPDLAWRRNFRRRLLRWYERHRRRLPWREEPTLYRVWVSEIMLQQTQVATVLQHFDRFLARFPDVRTLSSSSEQDVLRHWEGLGYYRRARALHQAAQQIVQQYHGRFPTDFRQVLELPGIGRYHRRGDPFDR